MPAELNTVSYILLTTIFSVASVIAIKHAKHPDAHPLVLISQSEFAPLRYEGESTVIQSKLHPGHAPALHNNDHQSISTLSDLYQSAFSKGKRGENKFLGAQRLRNLHENGNKSTNNKYDIVWVRCCVYFCNLFM